MGVRLKLSIKLFAIFIGFIAIVALIGIGLFWWSAEKMCGNVEVVAIPIAGTKYKVVVFQRDCGATTGFSTQASILDRSSQLKNNGGNIFAADTNHGAAPSGPGGGPALRVKVFGPQKIELSYHKNTRVFDAERQYKEIKILYSVFGN